MPKLTTVMLARDNQELTLAAVTALARELEAVPGGELVLLDQASREPYGRDVEELVGGRFPVRLLRSERNLSYAVAANRAAAAADGADLLLFLDNDTELQPAALHTLLVQLDRDPQIAAIGPKLLYPSGQIDDAGLALPVWLVPFPVGRNAAANDSRYNLPRYAFALSSSCLLVRREAFETVGGFDPGYQWGFESTDLALSLRKCGWAVFFEPRAECHHVRGATLRLYPELETTDANRAHFLERWGVEALRRVASYLDRLADEGTRRFLIFGTGESGRHLAHTLELGGYQVAGFVSPGGIDAVGTYPAWSVTEAPRDPANRVLIGSPYVRDAEESLSRAGLLGGAALPILLQ